MSKIVLLPSTVITTAVTGTATSTIKLDPDTCSINVSANFNYGSGGTTAKFWVQTSADGTDWTDIINFGFTTADLVKFASVNTFLAHTHASASDVALGDNTIANGLILNFLRLKYTTVGIYAGSTTIAIVANLKSLTDRKLNSNQS